MDFNQLKVMKYRNDSHKHGKYSRYDKEYLRCERDNDINSGCFLVFPCTLL